jgi:hypothetical protein
MKADYRLLRGVAGQFVMGAVLGALFVGVIILADMQGVGAAIAAANFPLATLAIFCVGPVLYFAFGAAITGFLFLVSDGVPDERDPAS